MQAFNLNLQDKHKRYLLLQIVIQALKKRSNQNY